MGKRAYGWVVGCSGGGKDLGSTVLCLAGELSSMRQGKHLNT